MTPCLDFSNSRCLRDWLVKEPQWGKGFKLSMVTGTTTEAKASAATPHISVCVCTYKRPQFLERLLEELGQQQTGGLFTFSVVVVDNDKLRSAEPVISTFANRYPISVRYCVESRQGI